MIDRGALVSAAILLATSGAAMAQQTPAPAASSPLSKAAILAKRFGAREAVRHISLSPDGTRYAALISTKGRTVSLVVGPVDGSASPKALTRSDDEPERLRQCDWANDRRIVCLISAVVKADIGLLGFTRIFAIDPDGANVKMISARTPSNALGIIQDSGRVIDWFGDEAGSSILITRAVVPESTAGTHLANTKEGLGVERVDPVTLKRSFVEQPNQSAIEYISDGIGTVRIMGTRKQDEEGYEKLAINYSYRQPGSRRWDKLSTIESGTGEGFDPYAVDPTLNVAYGFDKQDGRRSLFKIALDGSLKRELVYARPDVDIDDLIRIGRKHRVVGVTFSTDRRQTAFFDPELKKLGAALGKAMKDLPLVSFVDASLDEKKLLLWLGSDVEPGQYMVFDKATRHLDPLLETRPELNGVALSPVKSITYPAADGTMVPAYLTLPPGSDGKNIPAIVMPHGGPSSRDEWGFDWLAQFFAARGYAVLQPNYRGSSGYGDGWFQSNGFKSWRTAIGDINDGGRWMIAQGITRPEKIAIVGWSYGGYAALQSSVLDSNLFKAIVAIAPVTDLEMLRSESKDFVNFYRVDRFIGTGPHVREGSPAQNIGAIKVPVLMFHGDRDQNVGIGESRLMASKLKATGKPVELVEFPGLDHQIDDSEARPMMLEKADAFLRKTMGLPE